MAIIFNIMDATLPLAIETIGYQWEQETVQRTAGYPYYHWLQTERGCGKVTINNDVIDLLPGEGILLYPFVEHTYSQTSQEPWQTNFVTFGGTTSITIPQILTMEHYCLASDSQFFSFSQWLGTLYQQLLEEKPLSPYDYSIEAYRFLLKMKELHFQKKVVTDERYLKFVQPVMKWIETHYALDCGTKEMAQTVFISPQYLSRLFQKFLNQSPYEYLTHFRIKKAKERLISLPDEKIKDVASHVGYNDASHFIAQFKKATHYTPTNFRSLY